MITLLDKINSTFLGVEFKDKIITFACLRNEYTGMHLISSSQFPLSDDEETITNIKNFIAQNAGDTSNVFVSIPYDWSIVKFTEMPLPKGRGKDVLMNMMKFEIERHIPFQIDDVYYDFQVMERKAGVLKIAFVIVHRDKINYVKGFLEKFLLAPAIITLSPYASLNSIEFSGISVGGWQEFLGISKKPRTFGSKNEFSLALLLNKNEAFFALYGDGSCIHLKHVALNSENILDSLVKNISEDVSAIHIDGDRKKIKKVILSGDIQSMPDLPGELERELGVNVQTINPVEQFLPENINIENFRLASLIGVCYMGLGLGSLKINLLPHKTDFSTTKTAPMVAKIVIILIFFLIIGIFSGDLINANKRLGNIEEAFKKNEPKIKVIEKLTSDLNSLGEKRDFLVSTKKNNVILDVLLELTNLIPSDAWLTNFDFKKARDEERKRLLGELTISGQALSSSALISILEDSLYFEKVEFVGPITKRGDKEGFKIKASVVRQVKALENSKMSDKK
jgi:Tfp pilus assembly PilM family ATPase